MPAAAVIPAPIAYIKVVVKSNRPLYLVAVANAARAHPESRVGGGADTILHR